MTYTEANNVMHELHKARAVLNTGSNCEDVPEIDITITMEVARELINNAIQLLDQPVSSYQPEVND
jgi:hypothetical protein